MSARAWAGLAARLVLAASPLALPSVPAHANGVMKGGDPGSVDIVSSELDFSFDLYRAVSGRTPGRNVFLSPWSVSQVLAMALNGAAGETAAAMQRTLHCGHRSPEELGRAYAALRDSILHADDTITLDIANSLWLRKGMDFLPGFLAANQSWFGAEVDHLDFAAPDAPARVNEWVSRATHERIPTIVDHLDPDTALILVNAIYFKGAWATPFDHEVTREGSFKAPDGAKPVHMMKRGGTFSYYEDDGVQAVMLPYGHARFGMIIVLPREGKGLDGIVADLSAATWRTWAGGLARRMGSVSIPRFHIEQTHDLADPLKEIGMAVAFDPSKADFSRMSASPGRLFVKEVRHKTYVDVDEEGTEAAAATGAVMGITSMPAGEPFEFVADRPFLFAIEDLRSETILFAGSVFEPREK